MLEIQTNKQNNILLHITVQLIRHFKTMSEDSLGILDEKIDKYTMMKGFETTTIFRHRK